VRSRLDRGPSSLASSSPPFPRRIQLAVSLGEDHRLASGQLIRRRDIADGTVQADLVVMRNEIGHDSSCVVQAQRGLHSNALPLEGLVPPLLLPIALGIIGRCAHVRHAADPDELLEVLGDELRPVVRNDPGVPAGKPLARPLNDRVDVDLGHGLADFPVDDEAAAAVEEAAKIRVYFQIDSQVLTC
jgi:hypothetical protein